MKEKLGLLAFGTLLGLLLLEGFCRVTVDWMRVWHPHNRPSSIPGLAYELAPNASWTGLDGRTYTTNGRGHRGEEVALEKPAGELRVLVLGDSVAYGMAVEERDTAIRLLERRLRAEGRNVRLINTGVPSYNLWEYYFYLRERGWDFQPDGVLLFLCMNDSAPKAVTLPPLGKGEPVPWKFRARNLVLKSRLAYVLLYYLGARDVIVRARDRLARLGGGGTPATGAVPEEDVLKTLDARSLEAVKRNAAVEGWGVDALRDAFREMLDERNWTRALPVFERLKEAADERGAFFAVVVFPVGFQMAPGYTDRRPQQLIVSRLRRQGIDVVDLLGPFRASGERIFVPADLLHPNEKGHRLAADAVYPLLKKRVDERRDGRRLP